MRYGGTRTDPAQKDTMDGFRITAVVLAFATIVMAPVSARAGSVWDPNEPGHRLDIRWIGVYQQADGRMRITMTFHDHVRIRWFGTRAGRASASVGFTNDRSISPFWFVYLFQNRHHRLSARLCEGGSNCGTVVRVGRPNAVTIRTWIRPLYGLSFSGFSFKGFSNFDSTTWGVVT